ncbi:potassium transporter TrkA [Methanomicrobiaceae archaeon CYW5]|uniref:cation:proton antiporter regulatory subunit n=1 Tax=Methanovulcanius yangii TaxID=1789227 RepID=UPI0029C9DAFC|nr:TrkA C-terminal domain-containing protein [Methanovulcanius yangii]MBT8508856.1 potassium transporter TrkA [Methanovulcanius yangii]
MDFHHLSLPGIGTKYELETDDGDIISVVYMQNGKVQMYTCSGARTGCSSAELTAMEARRLGNVLTGAIIEAEQEGVEIAFSALADLRISVHTYIIGKSLSGKSIGEMDIRSKTGVTVLAVSREGENTVNPRPSFIFEAGDAVVVIGEADQIKRFEKDILG